MSNLKDMPPVPGEQEILQWLRAIWRCHDYAELPVVLARHWARWGWRQAKGATLQPQARRLMTDLSNHLEHCMELLKTTEHGKPEANQQWLIQGSNLRQQVRSIITEYPYPNIMQDQHEQPNR